MIRSCQQESAAGSPGRSAPDFGELSRTAEPGGLAAYIEAELKPAAPDRPDAAREVARAVEAFIRDHHRNETMASDYLLLLMARALWAIGETAAARRFIEAKGAEWRVAPLFVEAAISRDLSVPHWRALLGSRAVRSAATLTRGAIWIVDLRRLMGLSYPDAVPNRGGLELTLLRVINAMVDRMAGVWDHSRGEGILGLRHLDAAAAALLECSPRCRKSSALALEIRTHCEVRLHAAGKARGWIAVPEVISLDVSGS